MRVLRRLPWDTGCVLGLYAALILLSPRIFSALQIQPDEGYELIKGFLCWKGFALYTDIWNDQPPLHTLLLRWVFQCAGASIVPARILACAFGGLLVLSLHLAVKQTNGVVAGILAPAYLLLSPQCFALCVAVMLEVPAFAFALGSLYLAQRYISSERTPFLIGSGIAAALALQTKLTSVVVFAALMGWLLIRANGSVQKPHCRKHRGLVPWLPRFYYRLRKSGVFVWVATVGLALLLTSFIFGADFTTAYMSHFSDGTYSARIENPDYRLKLGYFLEHPEALLGACGALIMVVLHNEVMRLFIPLIMLVTVLITHIYHYPWWKYYYLHFEIPMAWLTAYAVARAGHTLLKLTDRHAIDRRVSTLLAAAVASVILGSTITQAWPRFRADLAFVNQKRAISEDALLAEIKRRANRTRWIYAPGHQGVYAFHAGIPVPPQLAVIAYKRFWCGHITTDKIVDLVNQYSPEQLLLIAPGMDEAWASLAEQYSHVLTSDNLLLYARKENE